MRCFLLVDVLSASVTLDLIFLTRDKKEIFCFSFSDGGNVFSIADLTTRARHGAIQADDKKGDIRKINRVMYIRSGDDVKQSRT